MSSLIDRVLIREYTTSHDEIAVAASEADAPAVAAALIRAHIEFSTKRGIDGYVRGKPEWGDAKVTFHFGRMQSPSPEQLRVALTAAG